MPRMSLALRSSRGIAATEFAVVAPMLILVLLSTADFGMAMVRMLRLEAAARAGAQYAFFHPQDSSGITSVVQGNLAGLTGATIQPPTMACKCDNGASADCTTGTCNGGTVAPIAYVSVTITCPNQFFSPISARLFPRLATLSGNVEVRLH